MGTEIQMDSSNYTTISVPPCRSTPSGAQPSPLKGPVTVCSACGRDGDGEPFHRLKHDGTARNFCSTCILFLYKGMYCCLCFVVYETPAAKGDSSLWVSCAKCQRIGHVKCARDRDLHIDSALFTCHKCSQVEKASAQSSCIITEACVENGSAPQKRLRLQGDQQSAGASPLDKQQVIQASPAEEVLAAAQIVALLAVQQAKDAKARARASAAAAARAAACAKAALDTAYRVAQDEGRWKPESSRRVSGVFPGNNRAFPSPAGLNVPKFVRVGAPFLSPHPSSGSLSYKDQVGKDQNTTGYGPSNARFTAQYRKMNSFPPSATVPHGGAFQKPLPVCVKETPEGSQNGGAAVESEGVTVSDSPASILDAAASFDTPRLSYSTEAGPCHCSVPEGISTASSSSMVLTRSDFSADSTNSLHQPSNCDERDQRCGSVPLDAVDLADNTSSDVPSSETVMECLEVCPYPPGKEKSEAGGLLAICKDTAEK